MKLESLAEPNLAGRSIELKELQQYLQSISQGKGTTVFISGEAGSGKTRLASEFLDIARAQGTIVLRGWCLSNMAVPYFPFIEALDSYTINGYANHNSGAQLTKIKTWLTPADGISSSPQAWKDQAFMAVAMQLLELSMKSPLVLFIDDLHWADSASLSLLNYLARCITSERILILVAYRSEEVENSPQGSRNHLKDVQRLMARSDLYHEIKLGNLNQKEVCSIVEGMLGGSAHKSLVEKMSASSQGLPLFVVESIRMLFEQNELTQLNNQWQLTVCDINIPVKVKDIIYRRIDFLKPSQKRILDIAAVIGEKFYPQLVAAVLAKDSINVLESLNYMANSTLLVHCEGEHYWFNHAKYREMLYETIPQLLKKEYHLRIAKILEDSEKSPKELPVNDLAGHYAKAGNQEKSIKYAIMAGRLALSRFSNNEALEYFSYALKNCSEQPDYKDIWVAASEGLGEGFFANGSFEQALKTFEEMGDCTEGIVKLRAYRRAMDSAFFMGEFQKLSALTKKADEYSVFDHLESARILMNRARAVTFLGNRKAGIADFEAALAIFEKENSLPDIARVLLGLGGGSHRQWRLEKGLANALRAILYFKELGDLRGLSDAYHRAGQSFGYRLLNQEALCMHQEAIRIGEKIGHYNRVAEAYASICWVYEAMNQYPQALAASLKALEYAKKTGSPWTNAIIFANLTIIYSKLNEPKQAQAYYKDLMALPKEVIANAFVRLDACKTSLALAKNQWPKANQYFQESLSSLESGANPSAELILRNRYADALEKHGQLNQAAVQRSQAQGLLRKIRRPFERSNLYAFFLAPRQLEFGKVFQIRFDIVNISVEPVEIITLEGLTPRGLKVQRISDCCSLDGDCIMVHPKTIGPFQSSSVKIEFQAERAGFFTFAPQVSYMGHGKKVMKYELSPVIIGQSAPLVDRSEELTIDASADLKIEFHNELTSSAFQYLLHCFIQDFVRQKMPLDVAGWRSLMDIAKNTKITKHSLYESSRSKGKPISELERIGLVESKYFPGQRGRGGRVLKVRAFYDNQAVRAQIKRLTAK